MLRGKKAKVGKYELILANVASKCSIAYGAMGAIGFIYESVKDELYWAGLSRKRYTSLLMKVGSLYCLDEKEYNKLRVREFRMSGDEIATRLKAIFGDGNGSI